MVATRETEVYRRTRHGQDLTPSEREKLAKPYLPAPRATTTTPVAQGRQRPKPIRRFLKNQLYLLTYQTIRILFSIYIWVRWSYHLLSDLLFSVLYYHHRTPELIRRDAKGLSRLPQHLSVILALKEDAPTGKRLQALMDEAAEIAAWSASAGIPTLSIYEKTGLLKSYIPQTHRALSSKLRAYFGDRCPSLQLRAPHEPSYLSGDEFTGDGSPPVSYGMWGTPAVIRVRGLAASRLM